MFQPSTYYKLVDPQGVIRDMGNAKNIRRARKRMGKGWTIGIGNGRIGDVFSSTLQDERQGKAMAKQSNNKRTAIETTIDLSSGELVIRMPLTLPPSPSASGKTLVLASTRGNLATAAQYDGQAIIIGVNAYIRKT